MIIIPVIPRIFSIGTTYCWIVYHVHWAWMICNHVQGLFVFVLHTRGIYSSVNWDIIGSDNGLSPVLQQTTTKNNDKLFNFGTFGTTLLLNCNQNYSWIGWIYDVCKKLPTISAMPQRAQINAVAWQNIPRQWPFVDIPCDSPNGGKGEPNTWVQLDSQPISTTKRMDGSRNDLSIKACRGGITSGSKTCFSYPHAWQFHLSTSFFSWTKYFELIHSTDILLTLLVKLLNIADLSFPLRIPRM